VAGCIVPNKVYGIMAAGRPFIASMESDAEAARTAREHGCGMVIPPDDPAALAEAIRWCRSHPNELACMGANARAALLAHYDRSIATHRFERVVLGNP
jgi:colanic acid biosynthesis glycosyl transferase WcaI